MAWTVIIKPSAEKELNNLPDHYCPNVVLPNLPNLLKYKGF